MMTQRIIAIIMATTLNAILIFAQDNAVPAISGLAKVAGKGNINRSPYYVQMDFYNMQSEGSLTLLPHFKTYQQTTEYTCAWVTMSSSWQTHTTLPTTSRTAIT